MKSSREFDDTKHSDLSMKKHYIITKPTRLSDLTLDDLEDVEQSWREQSRLMQARRWRKIRQQLT